MAKIKGKFAPFFEELGNDSRWLLELNDFEKLIFHLVLCTVYWCNGSAPDDAKYYKLRYGLNARPYQIERALNAIKQRFHKLIAKDKKLSLLNYRGYENRVAQVRALEGELEEEIEIEVEGKRRARKNSHALPDQDFFSSLKANPAFKGIDIDRELAKMDAWLLTPKARGRKKTKGFIVNWLNKIDKPITEELPEYLRRR